MRLLGERNWHLPRWLQWLPDVQVEGPSPGAAERTGPVTEPPAVRA